LKIQKYKNTKIQIYKKQNIHQKTENTIKYRNTDITKKATTQKYKNIQKIHQKYRYTSINTSKYK